MQRPRLNMLGSRVTAARQLKVEYPKKEADPFYKSPEWRALVKRLIAERGGACQCGCGQVGGFILGDHIVELRDGGARLDPDNIMLMRIECHNRKTAQARAARRAR